MLGLWPIATNSPSTGIVVSAPVVGLAQAERLDMTVAEDLVDSGVRVELDLGIEPGAVLHDLAAAELVAPMDQMDLAREAGQEQGLLERGVAAADDRDLLVPEEEPVARGAGADAAAAQPGLALEAEPDGARRRWRR